MRPCGVFNVSYYQDRAVIRTKLQWGLLIAFLLFLLIFPIFGSDYLISFAIFMCITIITLHGLNILMGYAGQISIGHAAFMAVGAFTSAFVVLKIGLPFWISLPIAGIVAALVGIVFGAPSLKIRGFYLALATVAAQIIIIYIITNWTSVTGGPYGLTAPPPRLGGLVFDTSRSFYYIATPLAIIMTLIAQNIARSKAGRAFAAIRDDEIAAEVLGINVFRYKLLAFAIATFYAGIAGSLYVHYIGHALAEFFPLMDSVWYCGMLVVGGLGTTLGPILGAVMFGVLQELVVVVAPALGGVEIATGLGLMVYALVIIVFLIFEPRGLAHRWGQFKAYYRLFPFSY